MSLPLIRPLLMVLLLLPLAACDPAAEDFTLDVPASPSSMIERASHLDFTEARAADPVLRVDESLPDDHTVVFTMPASSAAGHSQDRPTTVRLRFEAIGGGKTRVTGSVTTSDAVIILDGTKQLDRSRIVQGLREALSAMGEEAPGNPASSEGRAKLTAMLASVAMVSNDRQLAAIQQQERFGGAAHDESRSMSEAREPRPGEPAVDLDGH